MASFASRKNAACGKTMQANSYWNVPLLDAPHQSGTDRKEHRKYLTRVFQMRDPDITSIDQMNNLNVSLNTSRKDDWQEANEAQSCKLGDVSGRYSEKNDYNTKMVCKVLQQQAASHVDIKKFDGNLINSQYFMSIFKEVVEELKIQQKY